MKNAVRAEDRSPEATNPTFLVLRMGKRPATGMSPLHDTKGPSPWDIVLRPRGRVGPPGRPRTFSGIRPGRSNRSAVKMAPRQRPSPTTQSIVEKQKDVGIRAFSAKPFTGAASVMPKSGRGILPVITGHHRQDADATYSKCRWIKRDGVKTRIENPLAGSVFLVGWGDRNQLPQFEPKTGGSRRPGAIGG